MFLIFGIYNLVREFESPRSHKNQNQNANVAQWQSKGYHLSRLLEYIKIWVMIENITSNEIAQLVEHLSDK